VAWLLCTVAVFVLGLDIYGAAPLSPWAPVPHGMWTPLGWMEGVERISAKLSL